MADRKQMSQILGAVAALAIATPALVAPAHAAVKANAQEPGQLIAKSSFEFPASEERLKANPEDRRVLQTAKENLSFTLARASRISTQRVKTPRMQRVVVPNTRVRINPSTVGILNPNRGGSNSAADGDNGVQDFNDFLKGLCPWGQPNC